MPVTTPSYPDITQTRQVRTNYGFVVNLEQAITSELGVFSRESWSPGPVEIIGWTDCDESVSRHSVKGKRLGTPGRQDRRSRSCRRSLVSSPRAFRCQWPRDFNRRGPAQLSSRADTRVYYAYSLNKLATPTFSTISSSIIPDTMPTADRFQSLPARPVLSPIVCDELTHISNSEPDQLPCPDFRNWPRAAEVRRCSKSAAIWDTPAVALMHSGRQPVPRRRHIG